VAKEVVVAVDDAPIYILWLDTNATPGLAPTEPNPKAAIAVTAIRLKNVFFDITFLSVVARETFSMAAGKESFFAL